MCGTQGIAEGTPAQGTPLICDVRDVARAHVLAAEVPSASGRYIVTHRAPLTATALSKALQVSFHSLCSQPVVFIDPCWPFMYAVQVLIHPRIVMRIAQSLRILENLTYAASFRLDNWAPPICVCTGLKEITLQDKKAQ